MNYAKVTQFESSFQRSKQRVENPSLLDSFHLKDLLLNTAFLREKLLHEDLCGVKLVL